MTKKKASDSSNELVLILRFRDLNPPTPGTTIERHRAIVEKKGYVWWAWWMKQSESVPVELWSTLLKQVRIKPSPAWLVDSGQRILYRTTLQELAFDPGEEPQSAPEAGSFTPEYYHEHQYKTWFKLGPIEDAEEKELQNLVYDRVPHDDRVIVDEDHFVGHRLDGIGQLLTFGNVTYWVARRAPKSARTAPGPYEKLKRPAIAPRSVVSSTNRRILHISDLHASESTHAFRLSSADEHNKSLAMALYEKLEKNLPGLVVVTGDLTWSGAEEEFKAALDCLDDIRSNLGLSPDKFIIVPGNHDIQWTDSQKSKQNYEAKGEVTVASGL